MQNQNQGAISNGGPNAAVNSGAQRGRRLVLHFDVNNTILMKDTAKNIRTVQENIERIVCQSAWGRITQASESNQDNIPNWHLAYDQLSWTKPEYVQVKDKETGELVTVDVISYFQFLKQYYPTEGNSNAQQNKAIQLDRIHSFARPGGIGAKFKNILEKMLKAISLPKGAKEELDFGQDIVDKIMNGEPLWNEKVPNQDDDEDQDDGDNKGKKKKDEGKLTEDQKMLMTLFGEGKYHIIPSFFRTLIFLKKQKREFAVIFRTYGKDIDKITWEFNQFCNGNHPCFSGRNGTPLIKFDGSKGTKDLRIFEMDQKGLIFRFSNELSDLKLITGISQRISDNFEDLAELIDNDDKYENCKLIENTIQQHQHILETLKKRSTMTIQDDYLSWKENDYNREVAKILFVDQADYGTQHIFFDDNAEPDDECIVDVRDPISKEIIPYKKFINMYVIKAEPHRAILEPDYFIKMIEQAERSRDEEIERVEAGIIDDDQLDEPEVDNEWEKLQQLPNEEYLMKTVLPVLYQGMKIIDQQRPVAPIEYLALYLLKNQDKIKLPQKPEDL